MPLTPTEAVTLTTEWLDFARLIQEGAQDLDGEEKADGTLRRFSRTELKELARTGLRLAAKTLLDVMD